MNARSICVAVCLLSGCGAALKNLGKGNEKDKAQKDHYRLDVTEPTALASKTTADGIPTSHDELHEAYTAWLKAYDTIQSYQHVDYVGSQKLGDCATGERKGNKFCQDAANAQADAAKWIADILKAAIEIDPEPGDPFPLGAIGEVQTYPDIAQQLKIKSAVATLTEKWDDYWAKKAKKAGSHKELVRKEGKGMCFVSDAAPGKDIKPKLLFGSGTEELHIRCIAPEPLKSFERTKNDTIGVHLIAMHSGEGYNFQTVKEISVDAPSATEFMDFSVPVEMIEKKIKKDFLVNSGKKTYKDWSYYVIDVQYSVGKKIGVREEGDRLVDDIKYKTIAQGVAVLQFGGSTGDDEGDDAAKSGGDDDSKAKTKAKSKSKGDEDDDGDSKSKKKSKKSKKSDDDD